MDDSDDKQGGEKSRALEKIAGRREVQLPAGAGTPSEGDNSRAAKLRELLRRRQAARAQGAPQAGAGVPSQGNDPPRANLSELLKRGQMANTANAPQAGRGLLLRALARGAGGGATGNQGGRGALLRMMLANRPRNEPTDADGDTAAEQALLAGPPDGGRGNRALLLGRILQARQNRAGGEPNQHARELAELQNRVQRLTEEVERLRASQPGERPTKKHATIAADAKKGAAANRAKPGRGAAKTEKGKT